MGEALTTSALSIRRCAPGDLNRFFSTCLAAFGGSIAPDEVARLAPAFDPERLLIAYDGDQPVATAATVPFELSVPGGELPCAGVTMVGVLPSHRRRGIFRALNEGLLADSRARGEPVAALWSSEGALYAPLGFGLASLAARIDAVAHRVTLRTAADPASRVRLVDEAEAAERFAPLYAAARRERSGMPSRSDAWWRSWRLAGPPGTFASGPPMFRALLELDGEPAGYALYRLHGAWETGTSAARLDVLEAIAMSPRATAALWRFLLELDLVERVRALHLPRDHPLFLLARQPARLRMTLTDGLWIRIIDLAEALTRRSYAMDAELVLEVDDPSMSWNHGRWLVTASTTGGRVARTERPADLALTAEDLGSLYLGGVTVAALLDAGRVGELRPGAAEAFDGAFRTGLDPWCPDEF